MRNTLREEYQKEEAEGFHSIILKKAKVERFN